MIKAVGFDLGGVIIHSAPPYIYRQIQKELKVSEADLQAAMDEYLPSYDRGELNSGEFWHEVTQRLGIDYDLKQDQHLWSDDYVSHSPVHGSVLRLAEKLRRSGYKTAILSNIDHEHGGLNADRGIFEHFDAVLLSHQIEARKPEPAAFTALAERLGVKPAEVVFIDDIAANVAGARAAGMEAIKYHSYHDLLQQLRKLGVKV